MHMSINMTYNMEKNAVMFFKMRVNVHYKIMFIAGLIELLVYATRAYSDVYLKPRFLFAVSTECECLCEPDTWEHTTTWPWIIAKISESQYTLISSK